MKIEDFAGNPFASLSPSVWRGSTVVFDNFEDFVSRKNRQPDGYSYGITGTPTARQLEHKIAQLEGAKHCVVMPSGASALITTVLAFVRGGDHLLISESCYGSLKTFARSWLQNMAVEVEFYPPTIIMYRGADPAEHPDDLHGSAWHCHHGDAGHRRHHSHRQALQHPDHDG